MSRFISKNGSKGAKNLPLKEHKHTSENTFDLFMGKGKLVFSIRFNSHVFPHFLLLLQWIGADKLLYSFTWVRDYCINSMEMIHSLLAMKMKKKSDELSPAEWDSVARNSTSDCKFHYKLSELSLPLLFSLVWIWWIKLFHKRKLQLNQDLLRCVSRCVYVYSFFSLVFEFITTFVTRFCVNWFETIAY